MTRLSLPFMCLLGCALFVGAQTTTSADPSDEKPRIFVTDSQSWEMEGSAGGTAGTWAAHSDGGARPQTAEIIKTFGEKCPSVTVNNIRERAAYIVVLDHEGGKGALRHRNKVAVFDAKSGDSIVSKSTLSLGGSVEEACRSITRHWAEHKTIAATDPSPNPDGAGKLQPASVTVPAADPPAQPAPGSRLAISSIPDGADIEIDGAFMGNTPSSLQLQPGDHRILVSKAGYKPWERTIKISGGEISIKAELDKN